MKKITIFLIAAFLALTGCSNKKNTVTSNIVKNGEVYEKDNISFYYPNTYVLTFEGVNKAIFQDETGMLSYERIEKKDANQKNELVELFRLDLESEGKTILSNTSITLDNGDSCQEIVCSDETMKEKYMISFDENDMIILSFEADSASYDESITSINSYLYSLTIKEEEERIVEEDQKKGDNN